MSEENKECKYSYNTSDGCSISDDKGFDACTKTEDCYYKQLQKIQTVIWDYMPFPSCKTRECLSCGANDDTHDCEYQYLKKGLQQALSGAVIK
jgi:hypothetical protein